ncbi:MAG TPA: HAMP domain-containing sensor histidine kinase [Roseiflexaceae bacterium]|nr:HAMP domain-containing sensor histidine kinase [Roseiflexaceae bacterium]
MIQTQLDTMTEPEVPEEVRAEGGAGTKYLWPALLVAGPVLLGMLRLFPALDAPVIASPPAHVAITSGAAALGITLALLVTRTAMRLQDARVLLIGLGLLSVAGLFSVHAISTPNVLLHGRSSVTGWSALLSLLAGAPLLALSSLEPGQAANQRIMRHARAALLLFLALWLAAGAALLVPNPAPDHGAPSAALNHLRSALSLAGVLGYGLAAWRHYRLYQRAPTSAGLAISYGAALFGLALVTQWQAGAVYSLSFWLYHLQEFAAFGVISAALLAGYRSGQSGEGLLEGVFLSGTRARLRQSYTSALEALTEAIARGEQPTPAQRRALHDRFGLAESQIQALEQAAAAVAQERRHRQELERLNDALRQLQRDKEQLTQMVVHDLKNPLTAMIGFLEMLHLGEPRLADHQRELLESALRSGRNLAGLIGDLLDSARLEEGRLELNYRTFPLPPLLHECAGEMRAWLAQEGKTIWIDAPQDLPDLTADHRLLRRVLLNLVSNAIKHTRERTSITLRARSAGRALVIEVEDNGPGIAPEHLERIFDRFSQLGGSPARQESTGLGLTFCRLAVAAHGGTIDVESAPGRGTLFRVTLPYAPAAQE